MKIIIKADILLDCNYGSCEMLSIDDGWSKYKAMRGFSGDCWENSHEKVCKDDNTCI